MARSGFKMKYSPAKGRLDGFFSSLGKQLRGNKKDIGTDLKEKYNRTKESTPKAGESQYQADVRRRKATSKAKRNMVDKNKDNISDFIQPRSITTPSPKGQETVSSKPESKGNYLTFSGKPGDKFKYRIGTSKTDGSHRQFQRPGSDVWESSKTKEGSGAIGDLFVEDYEGQNVEITPIQKKSPSKKRGFRMKRKK